MCGGESSIRIEPAENGLVIEHYVPGGEHGPGKHRKMIASSPEHAMAVLKPHLAKIGKKKGRKEAKLKSASKRKATSRKRA